VSLVSAASSLLNSAAKTFDLLTTVVAGGSGEGLGGGATAGFAAVVGLVVVRGLTAVSGFAAVWGLTAVPGAAAVPGLISGGWAVVGWVGGSAGWGGRLGAKK